MKHEWSVETVAFSPDGLWIVTISGSTVRIWEVEKKQEIARMVHEGAVNAVAFSPDGQWLATGSTDGTARVWEATTGKEVVRIEHEESVQTVAFSPDGRSVASGSAGGTGRIWLWRPEDLIAEACARLPRNLKLEEWEQYLPGEPYRPTCPNLPVPEE